MCVSEKWGERHRERASGKEGKGGSCCVGQRGMNWEVEAQPQVILPAAPQEKEAVANP